MDDPRVYVERTLALIKPDAVHKCEEIEDIILKSGFIILQVGNVSENALVYLLVLIRTYVNYVQNIIFA